MTNTPSRDTFNALRASYLAAEAAASDLRATLAARYQDTCYAPAGKRKALETARRKADRAWHKLFDYLTAISPRDWSHSVPTSYIGHRLTFDDAVTAGQLATVPPPAWGYTDRAMQQFAEPVAREATC